ncbi:hypothetical protein [Streptomyces sp. 2A115]|uniref:hypothetical protein n=1 Tax=Streptomyces sp. 2A115 TaxID=3457439 RepID=UPI003FD2CA46
MIAADESKALRLVRWAQDAYAAYTQRDPGPLRRFIREQLRLTDRLGDRCQALALAIVEGLLDVADLSDSGALSKALCAYASTGVVLERDRTLKGRRIAYVGDFNP